MPIGGAILPTASFIMSPSEPDVGGEVEIDGSLSLSRSKGSTIESYEWTIDTPTDSPRLATGPKITHTWNETGVYTVSLQVTNSNGRTDTIAKPAEVGNQPPRAVANYLPADPTVSEEVTLDGTKSSDRDGKVETYEWELETSDGSTYTESGPRITYTWDVEGEYEVWLTVTDYTGKSDRDRLKLFVDPAETTTAPETPTSTPTATKTPTETNVAGGPGSRSGNGQDGLMKTLLGVSGIGALAVGAHAIRNRLSSSNGPDSGGSDPGTSGDSFSGDEGPTASPSSQSELIPDEGPSPSEPEPSQEPQPANEAIELAAAKREAVPEAPFDDIAHTRTRLLEAHVEHVRAFETLADDEDAPDGHLADLRDDIETIEAQVDALEEIDDELTRARSVAPEDRLRLSRASEKSLQSQLDRYDRAINLASAVGFTTEQLEEERSAVRTALAEARSHPPEAELREAITDVRESLGRVPTPEEVSDHFSDRPGVSVETYEEAFDSWAAALAGCEFDAEAEIQAEIRRVADEVDGRLSEEEFSARSELPPAVVTAYFEDWDSALEATLDEAADPTPDREEFLAEIERIAASTDGVLKRSEFTERSQYSSYEIREAFEDWDTALEKAGVDRVERLSEELRRVANELGHPPTTGEMNEHGQVSASMYHTYFGSYTTARDEVLQDEDLSGNSSESDTVEASPSETGGDDSGSSSADNAGSSTGATQIDGEQRFVRITDIESNGRLEAPIVVKVTTVNHPGIKRSAELRVVDTDDNTCWLNVWEANDIDYDWTIDNWYVLDDIRGKVWEDSNGVLQRQLSSTSDMSITDVGKQRPSRDAYAEDAEEGEVSSEQTTDDQAPSPATEDNQDGASVTEGEQETENDDDGDILGDIAGEFDLGDADSG
jgi:hypothetical protein